jgi:hypothetical protein
MFRTADGAALHDCIRATTTLTVRRIAADSTPSVCVWLPRPVVTWFQHDWPGRAGQLEARPSYTAACRACQGLRPATHAESISRSAVLPAWSQYATSWSHVRWRLTMSCLDVRIYFRPWLNSAVLTSSACSQATQPLQIANHPADLRLRRTSWVFPQRLAARSAPQLLLPPRNACSASHRGLSSRAAAWQPRPIHKISSRKSAERKTDFRRAHPAASGKFQDTLRM